MIDLDFLAYVYGAAQLDLCALGESERYARVDCVCALYGSRRLTAEDSRRAANMARSRAEGRTASLHTNLAQGWVFP